MADRNEPPPAAVDAKYSALSEWQRTAAEADETLTDALRSAHGAAVAGRARIDAIAAEIESVVADQEAFAVDTPLGGHEVQRLLLSKNREIAAVVAETRDDDAAGQAALAALRARYRDRAGES